MPEGSSIPLENERKQSSNGPEIKVEETSPLVKTSNFIVKPSEHVYPMTSIPRGVCLIINNVEFKHEDVPNRTGSDKDASRLESIFQELFFRVIRKDDLTTQEMRKEIKSVARKECNKKADALVIIILTHGDDGCFAGIDLIPDTDSNIAMNYHDIVKQLSNEECPNLRNKPKICFFQACNGNIQPEVVMPDCAIPIPNRKPEQLPIVSDMFLSFAAQAGYYTYRTSWGGYYARHLARALRDFSCKLDLVEMLQIVERRVRNVPIKDKRIVKSEDGKTFQTDEIVEICLSTSTLGLGWSKKLYFNPINKDMETVEVDAPTFTNLVSQKRRGSSKSATPNSAKRIKLENPSPSIPTSVTQTKLLVVGGNKLPEVLFETRGKWTTLVNTGLEMDHQVVANSSSGHVYVFNKENLFFWNEKTTVSHLSEILNKKYLFAHVLFKGKIYFMGGSVENVKFSRNNKGVKNVKNCSIYNPSGGTWQKDNEMPRLCVGRAAAVLHDKVYVTCGKQYDCPDKLHVFDPDAGKWTQAKGLNVPRCEYAIAACHKYIWVFGGCTLLKKSENENGNGSKIPLTSVERYSPTESKWTEMEPMKEARSNFSVSYFCGKFYAIGGLGQGDILNSVEIYDPEKNEWSSGPPMTHPRANHSSVTLLHNNADGN